MVGSRNTAKTTTSRREGVNKYEIEDEGYSTTPCSVNIPTKKRESHFSREEKNDRKRGRNEIGLLACNGDDNTSYI